MQSPSSSLKSSGNLSKRATRWWSLGVQQALAKAGANRSQVLLALKQVPSAQRGGLQFLVENMPASDLRALPAKFLLQHVALSYGAVAQAPWRKRIPHQIFLNDILPYASLNEPRDASFALLRKKALPLIASARTPAEAAQQLNEKLFPLLNVRYSTGRKRADQSPLESIASGKASCSGLSILLVDACRSVGIPARVVGTPLWANMRGNHTWVEVWDGQWHFLGAAEPDPQGLNRGWFIADAAQARKDNARHAIYASSWKKTGTAFPLVWAPQIRWVNAVNVTGRYAQNASTRADRTRVLIKVLGPDGKRVSAPVVVTDLAQKSEVFSGTSKDESADLNDVLAVELPRGNRYKMTIGSDSAQHTAEFVVEAKPEQLIVVELNNAVARPLEAAAASQLKSALSKYFEAPVAQQRVWVFPAAIEKLLRTNEAAVRRLAWQAYRDAPIHAAMKADFEARQVQFEQHRSPYSVRAVGIRPERGWGLVIAMHGGGGTAKEVNDSQWAGMQRHYKDHPEAGGYLYLALRAPNDTWNGFYDVYVYPLVANLIRQFSLFGEVDPNKVFLIGYSHGGYGAFAIGPKMPDRFAAIHASAAAPTDGETVAKTLRNTVFSTMVGEHDTMYGRLERVRRFQAEVRDLRGTRTDIYPVRVDVMEGFQHGNLKDHDKIAEMAPAVRNPVPRELTWLMTDEVITDFFWLHTDEPGKTREIDATCHNNQIRVTTTGVSSASLLLDSRLIDFAKPVQLELNGQKTQHRVVPSLRTLCETLQHRGDPDLAFCARLSLPLQK
ncbi:MAG: hypothetical protein JWN98_846 [Abditibacteriota bacterium]|nr:hypothetical protein [Abditibacteriota bacterium]